MARFCVLWYNTITMPLKKGKKNFAANVKELMKDNHKTGKNRGANGKLRPLKQVLAIAYSMAKKK